MNWFVKHRLAVGCAFLLGASAGLSQTGTPAAPAAGTSSMTKVFPIPVGQGANGVRFPYFENGKLKMFFNVGTMQRKDTDHVQMGNAKIITYDDTGAKDFTLLLPDSLFDLVTRMLSTDKQFVLKRSNFMLMGDSLEMDTLARKAKITGKTVMVIYNIDEMTTKEPAP